MLAEAMWCADIQKRDASQGNLNLFRETVKTLGVNVIDHNVEFSWVA